MTELTAMRRAAPIFIALGGFLWLACTASTAGAQAVSTSDPMTRDTIIVFDKVCLATLGDHKMVIAEAEAAGATKLPAKDAIDIGHGKAGSLAWSLVSPAGTQTIVGWSPPSRCSAYVRRVNAAALRDGVQELLDLIARNQHIAVRVEHLDTRPVEGGKEDRTEYLLQLPGDRDASVAVSVTASEKAAVQGEVTFTFLGEKH
jgi:hypothetical protein